MHADSVRCVAAGPSLRCQPVSSCRCPPTHGRSSLAPVRRPPRSPAGCSMSDLNERRAYHPDAIGARPAHEQAVPSARRTPTHGRSSLASVRRLIARRALPSSSTLPHRKDMSLRTSRLDATRTPPSRSREPAARNERPSLGAHGDDPPRRSPRSDIERLEWAARGPRAGREGRAAVSRRAPARRDSPHRSRRPGATHLTESACIGSGMRWVAYRMVGWGRRSRLHPANDARPTACPTRCEAPPASCPAPGGDYRSTSPRTIPGSSKADLATPSGSSSSPVA